MLYYSSGGINIKRLFIYILLLGVNFIYIFYNDNSFKYTYVDKEINVFKEVEIKKEEMVLKTYSGPITAYGPDCKGCTTGKTASGYKVSNGNIYYNDKTYGKIRIVAADKSLPFGTIIRIKDIDLFKEPVLAIVLDRGSAIGFNKKSYFDLLYKSEKETESFGRRNATIEVLRNGY